MTLDFTAARSDSDHLEAACLALDLGDQMTGYVLHAHRQSPEFSKLLQDRGCDWEGVARCRAILVTVVMEKLGTALEKPVR